MFFNLPSRFLSVTTLSSAALELANSEFRRLGTKHSPFSFKETNFFFQILTLCRNTCHLKSVKSLLIVSGLLGRELFLKHFLNSCFNVGALDVALSAFNTFKRPTVSLQNLMLRGLSSYALYEDVLYVFGNCRVSCCPSDDFTFPSVIKACSILGAFGIGKTVHCAVLRSGYERNVVILTALVDFYGKSGCFGIAHALIDRIPQPDLVSWNALIACYSWRGFEQEAFNVFKHIFAVGLKPNLSTLASVIPLCTRLGCFDTGKGIHGLALKAGYFGNNFLVPALISMYAGDAGELHLYAARSFFDYGVEKNVAVWNAMISAYAQKQMPFEAFEIFRGMLRTCVLPDFVTFVSIVPSCSSDYSIWYGKSIHAYIIKHGSENQISVVAALVSMYSKMGDMKTAKFLFDGMSIKSLLLWNVMVSGYEHCGQLDESLAAFIEIQNSGFCPDAASLISVISVCSQLKAACLGKSAHAYGIRKGLDSTLNVSNALLDFYSDSNDLSTCFKLFHKMQTRDVVSWNSLICGCIHSEDVEKALNLLDEMHKEGTAPDLVTLISVLPVFEDDRNLDEGMILHGYAITKGFTSDVSLVNTLISMYCKCGDTEAGRLLFEGLPRRGVVSWNALMSGYRRQNLNGEVLILYHQMIKEGQRPSSFTLINLLPQCYDKRQGKSIHAFATRLGILQETHLLSSMVSMYSRFEDTSSCLLLFELGTKRDISLWNAIMSALVQTKDARKAVAFFADLIRVGLEPCTVTILNLISACSELKSLNLAHSLLAYSIQKGFNKDVVIGNALIDLFARCGNICSARKLFGNMLGKNVFSWNVMIHGYCLHGDGEAALELFSQMQFSGVTPDDITFSIVLSACSHTGLLEQGWMVFNSMVKHGIPVKMAHYACIVDLLGRTGHLNEAYDIVKKLPCKLSAGLLESLLGACKTHGDFELGEIIGRSLLETSTENPESYVMLANVYAAAGRWTDSNKVRSNLEERRLRKIAGFSLLLGDGHGDEGVLV